MKTTKMSDEAREPAEVISEMTDTLRKNWEQAVRTGVKFQEETGKWWSSALNPGTFVTSYQEQFNRATKTANSVLPLVQKPVEEVMELAEQNSRTGVDLMKKAWEAVQTSPLPESQAKWTEFWTSSIQAAQNNTEALSQISSKALTSWASFLRKNVEAS